VRYRLLGLSIVGFILSVTPVCADEEMGFVLGRLADIESRLDKNEEMLNEGHLPAAADKEANKPTIDLTNIIESLKELMKRVQALEEKSASAVTTPKAALGQPKEKNPEAKKKLDGLDLGAAATSGSESDDVEAILMDLEKKGAPEKQPSEEEAKATLKAEKSAPTLSKSDFEAQYNEGLGLLKKGEHKAAASSFEYCLKTFPNQKQDDRVLYQLGKSYYGCKNYDQAKKSYAKAYRKNPKGSLAPYALFGLSQVFAQEKNMKNTCATLTEIGKKYPHLDTQLEKDVAAAKKDHCKG
jgi:TolA-binding protein